MIKSKKNAEHILWQVMVFPLVCLLFFGGMESGDGEETHLMAPDVTSYLYVGGTGPLNYTTIQEALDSAVSGGTIVVYEGVYYENIVIDTAVTLAGAGKDTTIIDGNAAEDVVLVTSEYVTLRNFTLRNGGNNSAGIILQSSNNTVTDCLIQDNLFGVYCTEQGWNTFIECTVISNQEGGFLFDGSTNNSVTECTIEGNTNGLWLDSNSNYNTITKCSFLDNENGMLLWGLSNFNVVSQCTFTRNTIGIKLWDAKWNNFFLNTFTDNTNHTESTISDNFWYSREEIDYSFEGDTRQGFVGNYWDDYTGTDDDGDGIGDVPYEVDADDDDNYPLLKEKKGDGIPGFEIGAVLGGLAGVLLLVKWKKRSL